MLQRRQRAENCFVAKVLISDYPDIAEREDDNLEMHGASRHRLWRERDAMKAVTALDMGGFQGVGGFKQAIEAGVLANENTQDPFSISDA